MEQEPDPHRLRKKSKRSAATAQTEYVVTKLRRRRKGRVVGENVGAGVYRGMLDMPHDSLIKILSSNSIPVNERVRASRTCKAFYDVLSGPHAFLDVKKLPGPKIHFEQFRKIIGSQKDTNTRPAMANRLRSSVTSLDLDLSMSPLSSEQFMFVSELQNLTDLVIKFDNCDVVFDISSLQVQGQPQKLQLQVSTLSITARTCDPNAKSLTTLLNRLARIVDCGAVRCLDLSLTMPIIEWTPVPRLSSLLEHHFRNIEQLVLSVETPGRTEAEGLLCDLCKFFMLNVESLKQVNLALTILPINADPTSLLSALGQLHLKHLQLNIYLVPEHHLRSFLTDLAENSGETLEYLAVFVEPDHALDFIQQKRFKKLTCLKLRSWFWWRQTLTSIINFIKSRSAGLPKLRLECHASRQENETEEQEEVLRNLISSESNTFDFGVQIRERP